MSYTAAAQGAFFLVGFGVLVAGLAVFRKRLSRIGSLGEFSPDGMAKVNLARRASRSLTVVGVLAAGVFLVLSVASFRKNGGENWEDKTSGAGGFAWWVETTSSVNRPADAKGEVDWLRYILPYLSTKSNMKKILWTIWKCFFNFDLSIETALFFRCPKLPIF